MQDHVPTTASDTRNAKSGSGSFQDTRARAPVFVLGCPRSGTTLLYHMLLSAGDFAVYRTESSVFNVLKPSFGNLSKQRNRHRLMDAWVRSKLFERSGLDERVIRAKIAAECRSWGTFMSIVMEEISLQQNVRRWADCTPEHLLYIPEIKEAFPNALVIHVIRDGRDVALSLEKQHWIRPLFPHSDSGILAAGLYWEWIVHKGRRLGRAISGDYLEVRFEDLILSPHETLGRLSAFIGHDLDYHRIQKAAIGSVNTPNTSFKTDAGVDEFNPVGRWKAALPRQALMKLEALAGDTLGEFGYLAPAAIPQATALLSGMRRMYRASFEAKLWLKKHTKLSRIRGTPDLSWI